MRSFPSSIQTNAGNLIMSPNELNAFGQQNISLNLQNLNSLINSASAIWSQGKALARGAGQNSDNIVNQWKSEFQTISGSNNEEYQQNIIKKMYMPIDNQNGKMLIGKKFFDLLNISSIGHLGVENELTFPGDIALNMLNTYRFQFKTLVNTIGGSYGEDTGTEKGKNVTDLLQVKAIPSLFNPFGAVIKTKNLILKDNPVLLDETYVDNKLKKIKEQAKMDFDTNDCSIKNLCKLSSSTLYNNLENMDGTGIGKSLYKYADFMYCRDVGKISNNHLITLRRFNSPIGDNLHIGHKNHMLEVGRLITWFGNGDNKLEDIMKFSFKETYKDYKSKIQEQQSQEDSDERGPVGKFLNSINPKYNKAMNAGRTGTHNYISALGGKILGAEFGRGGQYQHISSIYDQNRIYSPIPSTQDGHIYEGKLEFNNEFQVVFSYKLRSYDSINPRYALLDLLHNIGVVCYSKGTYWQGDRRVIGAPANVDGWRKFNAMFNKSFDFLEGIGGALASGSMDFSTLLSTMSNALGTMVNAAKDKVNEMVNSATANVDKGADKATQATQIAAKAVQDLNKRTGFLNGIKGMLKNGLGRPAIYQFDSMIGPGPVGFWHITLGNPLNPIISMGNLILDSSDVQFFGPLGLDDFPTEIRVICKFKHGRSRDLVEFERIFGDGFSPITTTLSLGSIKKYISHNKNTRPEAGEYNIIYKQSPEIPERALATGALDEHGSAKALALQSHMTSLRYY